MVPESRNEIYRWLRRCLIGPVIDGESENDSDRLTRIRPLERFQTGILFPIAIGESGLDAVEPETDDEEELPSEEEMSIADASGLSRPKRRIVPPSSVGFSFFVHGSAIELELIARGARYEPSSGRNEQQRFEEHTWRRIPLGRDDSEARTLQTPDRGHAHRWRAPVFESRAELFALWRPHADGWLLTVSLSNIQQVDSQQNNRDARTDLTEENERALFEVELECFAHQGALGSYPRADFHLLSNEDQELELRYRDQIIYAIGHGAAVDWTLDGDRVVRIGTDFLPRFEVPRVDPNAGRTDRSALEIDQLAAIQSERAKVCDSLDRFVEGYSAWTANQTNSIEELDARYQRAAGDIVNRMAMAVARMRAGVNRLRNDDTAALAFALANQAMANQMHQSLRSGPAAGKLHGTPQWRPFQLGFLLLTITSAIDEDADDRDLLDLIWFPTGGGKTEAYLALMAFVIWWRRLRYKSSGGGTTVLMRYTLRLLTKDQFRRAARLICAMELMRREQPRILGTQPVTLGLWVGGASSPNTFEDAEKALKGAIEEGHDRPPSLLVLESCPWCGSAFTAVRNFDAGSRHFRFREGLIISHDRR